MGIGNAILLLDRFAIELVRIGSALLVAQQGLLEGA